MGKIASIASEADLVSFIASLDKREGVYITRHTSGRWTVKTWNQTPGEVLMRQGTGDTINLAWSDLLG